MSELSAEYSYGVQVTTVSSTTIITAVEKKSKKKRKKWKKWLPFKCNLSQKCNQRFGDLLLLRNHLKTHISYDLCQFEDKNVDYWKTKDIEVSYKYCDKRGVVKDIFGSVCSILLYEEKRVVNIMARYLEPVVPTPTDQIKVIFGEYREKKGILLSIDDNKGVIELDSEEDCKIVPLKYLCKLIRE